MQINSAPNIHPMTDVGRVRLGALDIALVEAVAKRDQAALRVLFARHNVRIYRFVLRLTGNASMAEETVSDVFFDVWRYASRFQAKCQVSTWLLAIARNKALSKLRRRSVSQQEEDEVPLTIEDPTDSPEDSLDRKERGTILRLCLKKLSPAHQEVIDLVYYHEKTVGEVADIVGIPASTVKTRVHYARSCSNRQASTVCAPSLASLDRPREQQRLCDRGTHTDADTIRNPSFRPAAPPAAHLQPHFSWRN